MSRWVFFFVFFAQIRAPSKTAQRWGCAMAEKAKVLPRSA